MDGEGTYRPSRLTLTSHSSICTGQFAIRSGMYMAKHKALEVILVQVAAA
jgi:hypothetical protein